MIRIPPPSHLRQSHAVALGLCFACSALFLLRPLYWHPFTRASTENGAAHASFAEKAAINQIARVAVGARRLTERSPATGRLLGPIHEAIRDGEKPDEHPELLGMRLALYEFLEMDEAADEIRAALEGKRNRWEDPAADASAPPPMSALFNQLYFDGEALGPDEISRVVGELGFTGKLARLRNLKLKDDPGFDSALEATNAEAVTYLIGFAVVVSIVLLMLAIGLLILIVAWVQLQSGKLRRGFQHAETPGWLNFETFTAFLVLMIAGSFAGRLLPRPPSLPLLPALLLQLALMSVVFYPRIYGVQGREIRRDIGLAGDRSPWKEMLWGPVGYVAALPVVAAGVFVTLLIVRMTGQDPSQGMHPIVPMVKGPDASPVTAVMALLIAVVLAPVLEEITFRGFFYNALRSRFSAWVSIVLSAALFAGIHPQGIIGFPMLMAIGMALATLREWRGSLIAPIVAHGCTNGATLLIVLLGF